MLLKSIAEAYYKDGSRYTGNHGLAALLRTYSKNKNVFCSWTKINKLGINPRPTSGDILGIYCFPVQYLAKKYLGSEDMYGSNMPFLQVFEADPGLNWLHIKKTGVMPESPTDLEKTMMSAAGMSADEYLQLRSAVIEGKASGVVDDIASKTPEGMFLKMVQAVAAFKIPKKPYQDGGIKEAILQNKICRACGIDAIYDHNTGSFHTGQGESTQAVFLSIKGIKILQTLSMWNRADDIGNGGVNHREKRSETSGVRLTLDDLRHSSGKILDKNVDGLVRLLSAKKPNPERIGWQLKRLAIIGKVEPEAIASRSTPVLQALQSSAVDQLTKNKITAVFR